MDNLDLPILFEQIASSDTGAFRKLFDAWHPVVFKTALGYTKSRELASDAAQQVFLKIWERRTILRDVKDPASWLATTAKYQAFQTLKKEASRDSYIERILQDLPEQTDSPETLLIREQQQKIIDAALNQLTAKQKEAYLLHRHEGLTYKEIAAQTATSIDTVREHVYKAIKAIQVVLKSRKDDFISLLIIFSSNFF